MAAGRTGKVLVVYDSVPWGWSPISYYPAFKNHDSWDGKAKNTIYGTFVEIRKRQ